MNSAAGSKSLHFREHYELRLNAKPVPVCAAGSFFSPHCSPVWSILYCPTHVCVVDHAINPITNQAMSTEEATASQHNVA